jgi:hypothetical protein
MVHCAVHNNREAVGVCLGCGAGVCPTCRVSVAGLTYCRTCLEAGRARPPPVAPSGPKPAVSTGLTMPGIRSQLTMGIVGLLLFGVASHITWVGGMFWPYIDSFVYVLSPASVANLVSLVSVVLTGTSMTLVGIAFYACARLFQSRLCQATAVVSLISAWWLPVAGFLQFTGLVWEPDILAVFPYVSFGSLFYPYWAVVVVGLTLEGVTLLLWPSALIATREMTGQGTLAVSSGVLFVIAAHVILLSLPFNAMSMFYWSPLYYIYYPTFSGVLLLAWFLEPASILGAILMYRCRGLEERLVG